MYRPFKFLLFSFVIQRYHSVDGYAPGSLIWSRSLQKFIPIDNVSTFGAYEQEIVAKSRQKENHNFRGKVLELAYFQKYNMVNFIDNNTKITGVCGDIWNTLAEYSNFTLVTTRVPETTENRISWRDMILNMIHRNKTQIIPRISFSSKHLNQLDFTTPIWETSYRIYIKPEWKADTNWIFNIFERKVWFAILFCVLLSSALGYLMQNVSIKVSGDENERHNFHDHLFYTFGTLCSRGSIPETLDRRSKILDVSKKIFAGLLLIVLSSHVMSHMTNVKVGPPFEDIESLLNTTNYTIAIYYPSLAFDQYAMLRNNLFMKGVDKKPGLVFFTVQEILHKTRCDTDKRALFESEDTKQAFGNRFCKMVAVGKSYFPTWITFGVPKRFKYKRTFDIGILKMKEFGLIDRLKKRWLKTSAKVVNSENVGHAPFVPINLDQVLMLFKILGIGMVASATIFVLEVIVSIYKSNQRRSDSGEVFIGEAGLDAHRPPMDNHRENRMRREIELSEVSTRPIYVQNVFVVDPNCSRVQDNEYPHRTFYN